MDLVQSFHHRGVRVVAVTKNRSMDEIQFVLARGVLDIGENRLQEAQQKWTDFPPLVTKHFIGRLQKNKVRDVVKLFDMIQSVDSLELAKKIESECVKIGKTMPVLVQVNTSGELQKGGCKPEETAALVQAIRSLPHLKAEGLMTVACDVEDPEAIRSCFKKLKKLFDQIGRLSWLSMGMSNDYKIALEEGTNMVRLGRALFEAA